MVVVVHRGHGGGCVQRSWWWWCIEVTLAVYEVTVVVYVSDNGGLCRSR